MQEKPGNPWQRWQNILVLTEKYNSKQCLKYEITLNFNLQNIYPTCLKSKLFTCEEYKDTFCALEHGVQ